MANRFTQYGGALGAEQALREMVASRIAAEMEARKRAVEDYKIRQDDQRIGQGKQRIDLDTNEFGYRQDRDKATDAATAAKQAEVQGFLRTAPSHMQPVLQARSLGLGDHDQHDFEAPEAHQAHVAKEEADKRATGLQTYEQQRQIDAKYRAPREERTVQIMGPNGVPIWVKESDAVGQPAAQAPRAVTGAERQTLSYYNRAKQASDDITPIEDQIAKMGAMGDLQLQYAPNFAQSGTQQLYRQAQRAFTEARLRKESGAAIPTGEYENDAKTYFAQPGDGPDVLQQKRRARQVVLDGMKNSSGKAFDEYYGQENRPQQPQGGAVEYDFIPGKGLVPRR